MANADNGESGRNRKAKKRDGDNPILERAPNRLKTNSACLTGNKPTLQEFSQRLRCVRLVFFRLQGQTDSGR
jgi:hypothetical protein